jgi:hypothetical protein
MKNASRASATDKRKYFRIDDVMFLSYRLISSAEVHSARNQDFRLPRHKFTYKANMDRLSRELHPLYNLIKLSDPDIALYLATLDKKINLLSEYLIEDNEAANDIEPQQVNIGAGGLAFISDEPFVLGVMLELQIKLLPEYIDVFSYGKVISCRQLQESTKQPAYKTAVEFEFMDDDVRDLITRHVLGKERALINKA